MNQRLALLCSILANPDDDLPRLVFADWLEENGTSDADAARVEFIRLGCKSKAKTAITPKEGEWLDENWQRLLPTIATPNHRTDLKQRPPSREGRFLRITIRYVLGNRIRPTELIFEFVRGFARRVEHQQGHAYQRFWRDATTDEPLAYHRPALMPTNTRRLHGVSQFSCLARQEWGDAVFDRLTGADQEIGNVKYFYSNPSVQASTVSFHPLVRLDLGALVDPQSRQRAAVATAMTALAREYVGLAIAPPAGGGDAYQ